MKKWQRHLTERDREILRFAARYRAITLDMVEERYFEGVATQSNAARVLRRLAERGLLRKASYFPPPVSPLKSEAGDGARTPMIRLVVV